MTKRSYLEAVLLGFQQYYEQKHPDDSGKLVTISWAQIAVHTAKARLGKCVLLLLDSCCGVLDCHLALKQLDAMQDQV